MKKILLLACFAALAFAFTACGYDGRTTNDGPATGETVDWYGVEKTIEPVELLIWLDNEDWGMELIQAFVNEFPNVTVLFEQMGNVDARTNLLRDGPAGLGPDIFAFPHDHVAFAIMDGLVEPVPLQLQAKWERELVESAVQTITYNGAMHGVPFQVENIAMFYNRELWGPNPPETWEEIFEFAATYNNPATNDWAFVWQSGDPYLSYIFLTLAGFELFGPNMDDFRQPNFDSPEVAAGLEIFLSMRELMDIPFADINFNTTEERFRTGQIPLNITGPWAIPDLLENNVDFGVARIPTLGGVQPIAFSGNMMAGVSSFSNNNVWAHVFLDFMVSEAGATIQYTSRNTMTSRRDISGVPGLADDPFLRGIQEQTPFTVPMPTIPQVQQMWTPMSELFEFTWDGHLTIPEAQERAMETYRMLIEITGIDVDF